MSLHVSCHCSEDLWEQGPRLVALVTPGPSTWQVHHNFLMKQTSETKLTVERALNEVGEPGLELYPATEGHLTWRGPCPSPGLLFLPLKRMGQLCQAPCRSLWHEALPSANMQIAPLFLGLSFTELSRGTGLLGKPHHIGSQGSQV